MYKHKDVIAQVRHPAIFGEETETAVKGIELPQDEDERRFVGILKVYERRWSAVSEIRSQIYPLLLEAEAIWGKKARDLFQPIWLLESELSVVIGSYLRAINPRTDKALRKAAENSLRMKRDIMYDTLEEDGDIFKGDYLAAMGAIEGFMKPKLGRRF